MKNKHNDLPLLTIRNFAARIDYKMSTVRQKIRRGEIEYFRVGPRSIRIPASELDRLLHRVPRRRQNAALPPEPKPAGAAEVCQ
jgi:excisionase family DNA binding protein